MFYLVQTIENKISLNTMKRCIAEKQCKLGKALDIGAPLFLTKHITVRLI
jgi:hypothetical protein